MLAMKACWSNVSAQMPVMTPRLEKISPVRMSAAAAVVGCAPFVGERERDEGDDERRGEAAQQAAAHVGDRELPGAKRRREDVFDVALVLCLEEAGRAIREPLAGDCERARDDARAGVCL